jgi:hypothetical protein
MLTSCLLHAARSCTAKIDINSGLNNHHNNNNTTTTTFFPCLWFQHRRSYTNIPGTDLLGFQTALGRFPTLSDPACLFFFVFSSWLGSVLLFFIVSPVHDTPFSGSLAFSCFLDSFPVWKDFARSTTGTRQDAALLSPLFLSCYVDCGAIRWGR